MKWKSSKETLADFQTILSWREKQLGSIWLCDNAGVKGSVLCAECYVLGLQLFLAGSLPKRGTATITLWAKYTLKLQLKFLSREMWVGRRSSVRWKQKYIKIVGDGQ